MMKKVQPLILLLLLFMSLPSLSNPADTQKKTTVSKKKINPRAFELCQLAVKVASQGDYNASVVYLKRALELDPKFPDALFNLGSIYRVQKKYQDSYAAFQQLLMINPKDHEARLEKVLTLIGMKSYKDADNELQKVPASEKRYASVKAQLDKVYSSKQLPEVAFKPKAVEHKSPYEVKSGLYASSKASPDKEPAVINKKTLTFTSPTGIAADTENNIYVANFTTNTIEKISLDGNKRETFASGEEIAGPSGIIYDEMNKQLLVSNYKSGTIISIDSLGRIKVLVDNLEKPYSLYLQKNGRLYVSEQGKKVLSIISIH